MLIVVLVILNVTRCRANRSAGLIVIAVIGEVVVAKEVVRELSVVVLLTVSV